MAYAEDRRQAFQEAFKDIHITEPAAPGTFDNDSDPIAKLAIRQKLLKDRVPNFFAAIEGLNPEHLRGLNRVMAHDSSTPIFGEDKLDGTYTPGQSTIHLRMDRLDAKPTMLHEIGHLVHGHGDNQSKVNYLPNGPEHLNLAIPARSPKNMNQLIGREEAEADSFRGYRQEQGQGAFSDHDPIPDNIYVHSLRHLDNRCTESHNQYSHEDLRDLGTEYMATMKDINPDLHTKLVDNDRISKKMEKSSAEGRAKRLFERNQRTLPGME